MDAFFSPCLTESLRRVAEPGRRSVLYVPTRVRGYCSPAYSWRVALCQRSRSFNTSDTWHYTHQFKLKFSWNWQTASLEVTSKSKSHLTSSFLLFFKQIHFHDLKLAATLPVLHSEIMSKTSSCTTKDIRSTDCSAVIFLIYLTLRFH